MARGKSGALALKTPADFKKFFHQESPKRMAKAMEHLDAAKELIAEEGLVAASTAEAGTADALVVSGASSGTKKKRKTTKKKEADSAPDSAVKPKAKRKTKKKSGGTPNAFMKLFTEGLGTKKRKGKKRGGRKSKADAAAEAAERAVAGNVSTADVPNLGAAGPGKRGRGRAKKLVNNPGAVANAVGAGYGMGIFDGEDMTG